MSTAPTTGSDIWSAASHDLRTPLAAVTGYAELLRLRDDEATRLQAADQILAASARLAAGIDDILTLLAIAEDDYTLDPVPIRLREAVASALSAEGHWLVDECLVADSASPLVRADPEALQLMLSRIVAVVRRSGNGDGSKFPQVDVEKRAALGVASMQLAGGAARFAASRFELHVATRLAELHGGWVRIASLGEAAQLELALPLATPAVRNGVRRILIVDDDDTIRSLLRLTLPCEDYEMIEASTGAEAIERASGRDPDLVLLDWRMPGQSGEDVLRVLKDDRPQRPVIVVTSDTDGDARTTAAALGADLFLSKPFSPMELLEAVERLVAR